MSTKAKLAIAVSVIAVVIVPLLSSIALAASNPPNEAIWNPTILKGPLVTCVGMKTGGSGSIPVCANLCDLVSTMTNVIYYIMGVLLWIVLPIMVAWGGIRMLTSRGSPGAVSEGRKIITGTVVGLMIVLAAYLIVFTFVKVLGISGIGGFTSNGSCIVANYTPNSYQTGGGVNISTGSGGGGGGSGGGGGGGGSNYTYCGSDCSSCTNQSSCTSDTIDNCVWDATNNVCYVSGSGLSGPGSSCGSSCSGCYNSQYCNADTVDKCTWDSGSNTCVVSGGSGGAGSCGSDCSGCSNSISCSSDPNCTWDGVDGLCWPGGQPTFP